MGRRRRIVTRGTGGEQFAMGRCSARLGDVRHWVDVAELVRAPRGTRGRGRGCVGLDLADCAAPARLGMVEPDPGTGP